jgi:hypothetical protein
MLSGVHSVLGVIGEFPTELLCSVRRPERYVNLLRDIARPAGQFGQAVSPSYSFTTTSSHGQRWTNEGL